MGSEYILKLILGDGMDGWLQRRMRPMRERGSVRLYGLSSKSHIRRADIFMICSTAVKQYPGSSLTSAKNKAMPTRISLPSGRRSFALYHFVFVAWQLHSLWPGLPDLF